MLPPPVEDVLLATGRQRTLNNFIPSWLDRSVLEGGVKGMREGRGEQRMFEVRIVYGLKVFLLSLSQTHTRHTAYTQEGVTQRPAPTISKVLHSSERFQVPCKSFTQI